MGNFTRRGFAGLSLAGIATAAMPLHAMAAAQCAAGGMPPLIPNRLAVECASRANFSLFRQYPSYVGLAGVVSVIDADGPGGFYKAGSLVLFPWLKPKALATGNAPLLAAFPTNASTSTSVKPIPGSALPQDEYLCRFVLGAPWQSFIGFMVDTPPSATPQPTWYTPVAKLAGGQTFGVDWTSSNLNTAWFGGASIIPAGAECDGQAWRSLIVQGLSEAAAGPC